VVIGPTLFRPGSKAAPNLEYGGEDVRERPRRGPRAVRYRPRPFMAPAFAAELGKMPAAFAGTVVASTRGG
jgi:hypothetical protein